MSVTAAAATLEALGATTQVSASAKANDGSGCGSVTFSYASSAPNVATVNASGVVTAVANGDAKITATADGKVGSVDIKVAQRATSVTVTPAADTLEALGATVQLIATAKDANGNAVANPSFTWSSSAANVVSVTNSGLARAVANGSASVSAAIGNVTSAVSLLVAQRVASVTVTPATATLAPGATQQFAASAKDANNNDVAVSFLWVSSNHNVAIINSSGVATGVNGGTATITAAGHGIPGTAELTVSAGPPPPPPPSATQLAFSVQPSSVTQGRAISPAIEVEVRDANGALVPTARNAVTLSIGANPAGGMLRGSTTVRAVNGVATFSGLAIDRAGDGYTLVATSGDLTSATSDPFNVFTAKVLSVSRAGTGTGTVASSPAGIACGFDCAEAYDHGTEVTLTATPATGSVFAGWSGACTGTGTCIVTMDAAKTVTATFNVQHTLTVVKAGSGSGTVTSSPAGINCGTDCSEIYNQGTVVTLSPAAATGSAFTGWSGACTGTGTCTVTMDGAKSVTATFVLQHSLTVAKAGTGTGTVISSPVGISCGTDCTEPYNEGTVVTLTATATAGSGFTGWSGGGCSGTGTCTVTVSGATTVTATFVRQHALNVTKGGNGSGTVTSNPAGISCGSDCTEPYNEGTLVSLTAAPATGSTFTGWSGSGCTGTGTCTVTIDGVKNVTATFTAVPRTLTVSKDGSGTVTSNPAGISCGSDCSQSYPHGTSVTLTATPASGWSFKGWSGGGCSGDGTCVVTMTAETSVTATFVLNELTVTPLSRFGTGGRVTSDIGGISCASGAGGPPTGICSAIYDQGTVVTLTADPNFLTIFRGWGGACSGTQRTCVVTMTEAKNVTADFR